MKLPRQLALVALALCVMTALAIVLIAGATAPGSTLSREAFGWIVARRYAEERGIDVRLLDHLTEPPGKSAALFYVFPWQRQDASDDARSFALRHALGGGTLVVAYTGSNDPIAVQPEQTLLKALGVRSYELATEPPPRHPLRWRAAQEAEWPLLPVNGPLPEQPARVRRIQQLPRAAGAMTLLQNPEGQALVSILSFGRGRIVLLPAEALANARLSNAGNAALLETLIRLLPPRWVFDEYHHGLVASGAGAGDGHSERAFVLFFVHAAIVYLIAVLALARRFGPHWREPLATSGSVRSFFIGVGGLHARLGHHQEAATLLLERARELDPALRLDARPASEIGRDAAAFIRHAQAVSRAQQRRKS